AWWTRRDEVAERAAQACWERVARVNELPESLGMLKDVALAEVGELDVAAMEACVNNGRLLTWPKGDDDRDEVCKPVERKFLEALEELGVMCGKTCVVNMSTHELSLFTDRAGPIRRIASHSIAWIDLRAIDDTDAKQLVVFHPKNGCSVVCGPSNRPLFVQQMAFLRHDSSSVIQRKVRAWRARRRERAARVLQRLARVRLTLTNAMAEKLCAFSRMSLQRRRRACVKCNTSLPVAWLEQVQPCKHWLCCECLNLHVDEMPSDPALSPVLTCCGRDVPSSVMSSGLGKSQFERYAAACQEFADLFLQKFVDEPELLQTLSFKELNKAKQVSRLCPRCMAVHFVYECEAYTDPRVAEIHWRHAGDSEAPQMTIAIENQTQRVFRAFPEPLAGVSPIVVKPLSVARLHADGVRTRSFVIRDVGSMRIIKRVNVSVLEKGENMCVISPLDLVEAQLLQALRDRAVVKMQAIARQMLYSNLRACMICLHMVPKIELQETSTSGRCTHRVCSDCFQAYIKHAIDDGRIVIKCPGACHTELLESDIARIVPGYSRDERLRIMKEKHEVHLADLLSSNASGAHSTEFLEWTKRQTRACPNCNVLIFRHAGCDHMTCRCGTAFDWGSKRKARAIGRDALSPWSAPRSQTARWPGARVVRLSKCMQVRKRGRMLSSSAAAASKERSFEGISDCLGFLEGRYTEFIFRVPGRKDVVEALFTRYAGGEKRVLHQSIGIAANDVASLLKKILSNCKLIRKAHQKELLKVAAKKKGPEKLTKAIHSVVSSLSGMREALTTKLFRYMAAVVDEESTKMSAQALAICLAPTLFHVDQAEKIHLAITVLHTMIERTPEFFPAPTRYHVPSALRRQSRREEEDEDEEEEKGGSPTSRDCGRVFDTRSSLVPRGKENSNRGWVRNLDPYRAKSCELTRRGSGLAAKKTKNVDVRRASAALIVPRRMLHGRRHCEALTTGKSVREGGTEAVRRSLFVRMHRDDSAGTNPDRVLVKRAAAVTQTKGGILLPESATKKEPEAEVVAVGPGRYDQQGNLLPMSVAVGDKVLLPEYGGQPVKLGDGDDEYQLFRNEDLLGKYE
ncbi:10 kDa heat shock protein, partial [Durusdinium trenchii]